MRGVVRGSSSPLSGFKMGGAGSCCCYDTWQHGRQTNLGRTFAIRPALMQGSNLPTLACAAVTKSASRSVRGKLMQCFISDAYSDDLVLPVTVAKYKLQLYAGSHPLDALLRCSDGLSVNGSDVISLHFFEHAAIHSLLRLKSRSLK